MVMHLHRLSVTKDPSLEVGFLHYMYVICTV